MDKKRVYTFGNGQAEGKAGMRNLLGGKGDNLAEMNLIGVPVPPGFTITTEVCTEYYEMGQEKVVALLKQEVENAIAHVETLMRSKFGDVENPLLVSVRSGARASMPGMMDTILNLGLNDEVVEGAADSERPEIRLPRPPAVLRAHAPAAASAVERERAFSRTGRVLQIPRKRTLQDTVSRHAVALHRKNRLPRLRGNAAPQGSAVRAGRG